MRSLAVGDYTHEQVETVLRSTTFGRSWRFDILTNDLAVVGELPLVDEHDPLADTGVLDVTVEMNVDRAVRGACSLSMFADERLRDMIFQRKIRPWFQVTMPDGGVAEWPMGVYIWNQPARTLDGGVGPEVWDITLGDQLHVLDVGGPGREGFGLAAGTNITQGIARVLGLNGFPDVSGIASSPSTVSADLTWTLAVDTGEGTRTQLVSWLEILRRLHDGLGYNGPWFDLEGQFRAEPAEDLVTATPGAVYGSDADGITLVPVAVDQELDRIANRVRVSARNGEFVGVAWADANTLAPGHPLAQRQIGFYIDNHYSDTVASNLSDLQARANRECRDGLASFQRLAFDSLAWPAHEAFDILGVLVDGDVEFGSVQRGHERRWSFGRDGQMSHEIRRVLS